jgi:hypothetical protein
MCDRPGAGAALIMAHQIDLFRVPQLADTGCLETVQNGASGAGAGGFSCHIPCPSWPTPGSYSWLPAGRFRRYGDAPAEVLQVVRQMAAASKLERAETHKERDQIESGELVSELIGLCDIVLSPPVAIGSRAIVVRCRSCSR